MKQVRKYFEKLTLIIFGAVVLFSCSGGKKQVDEKPKTLDVLKIEYQTVTVHNEYPATIQGEQVIEIRPRVEGYVEAIYVSEGAAVKKGQLLFRISSPQFEEALRTAEAGIKSAEADVFTAQMNVNKVKPLVEKDIVSKYELESAQYALQAKQAALAESRASLANARANVGYTYVRSPLDGFIGNIPYKVGALVNSSTTEALTSLSEIENVYAYFSLNEKQLLTIGNGSKNESLQDKISKLAKASLVLADGTKYPTEGKLEMASGMITTETGTVSLKALFSNPHGTIRSGASATIRLPLTIDSALLVPQSATYEILDKRFLVIVGADNRVHSIPFSSAATDDGQFFIVQQGITKGTNIVLNGITGLKDSTLIISNSVDAGSIYHTAKATQL